ncbi:hypothetical protein FRX31_032765, partial [Thalictrum thalictroides]
MKDFLWGSNDNLVNWEKVCSPKEEGGLGVRNLTLRGKWLWKYGNEENALRRRIIDSKYGRRELEEWLNLWPPGTQQEFGDKLWSYLPFAILWTLWKTRNHRIFRQKPVEL